MGAVLTVCSCLLRYIYLYVGIVEVAPPICEEKRGLISTLLTRTDAFNLLPFFFFFWFLAFQRGVVYDRNRHLKKSFTYFLGTLGEESILTA